MKNPELTGDSVAIFLELDTLSIAQESLKNNGLSLLKQGFSLIPFNGKQPSHEVLKKINGTDSSSWLKYKTSPISPELAEKYFRLSDNFAVIGGFNGLISFDFDVDKGDKGHERYDIQEQFDAFKSLLSDLTNSTNQAYIERSPSGGYHVVMLCHEQSYDTKLVLAATPKIVSDRTQAKGMIELLQNAPMTIYGQNVLQGDLTQLQETPAHVIDALIELCQSFDAMPEKVAPTPRTKRTYIPDPNAKNVIQEFNNKYLATDILERNGYERISNKRYLKPSSDKTKNAGVAILNDDAKCFSHHAGDVLSDGHSHDAFSLFTILEHGSDASIAFEDAARELGLWKKQKPKAKIDKKLTSSVDEYHTIKQRYLDASVYEKYADEDTILIVQSALGTAKTYALAAYAKGKSDVLGVTHLTALALSNSQKFEAIHYQDLNHDDYKNWNNPDGELASKNHRFTTCLNSLPKLATTAKHDKTLYAPDLLFIDEIDQCVHRLADKDVTNADAIHEVLLPLINKSKRVVLMSAYIDESVIELVRQATKKKIVVVENTCQVAQDKSYETLKDAAQHQAKVLELLKQDKQVAVPMNSLKKSSALELHLKDQMPNKKVLLINSETKEGHEQKRFILNPDEECKSYDCVIYSPTLNAGFSVSSGHRFEVCAYLSAMSNSPKDAMQLIHRFRDIEHMYIACDSRKQSLALDFDSIYQNINETIDNESKLLKLNVEGLKVFADDNMKRLVAAIQLNDNKQRVDYKKSFFDLLSATGRSDTTVQELETTKEQKESYKLSRQTQKAVHAFEVSTADELSQKEADELQRKRELQVEEIRKLELYDYLNFYGLGKSDFEELELYDAIVEDDDGKQRQRIKRMFLAQASDEQIEAKRQKVVDKALKNKHVKHVSATKLRPYALEREFYQLVLSLANIEGVEQKEHYTKEAVKLELEKNYKQLKRYKSFVDIPSKKKLLENPLQWLGYQLKALGFSTKKVSDGVYKASYSDLKRFKQKLCTLADSSIKKKVKCACEETSTRTEQIRLSQTISNNFKNINHKAVNA